MTTNESRGPLHLVICAAPPCQSIVGLIDLLHADDWDVYAIATPTAASWLELPEVGAKIGRPVLHERRRPGEPSCLPKASTVAVIPATFNTINAWATGVNDNLALGILNEALGSEVAIYASVYAKPSLVSHPAFAGNLRLLRDAGVRFTDIGALRPHEPEAPFRWELIVGLLRGGKLTI
jgi:phosphopantothenoylcysteine decarboxylase